MSQQVTLDNKKSTGLSCQRNGCTDICAKPNYINFYRGSSKLARHYSGNVLCDSCSQLCCYTDVNSNTCNKSVIIPGLCINHRTLLEQLDEYKRWIKAVKFHESYVYVGSHWEKADSDGPIDIYHYLSRDKYNEIIKSNPKFNFTNFWQYDEEIWICDDLWSYCGPYGESRVKSTSYPDDFQDQIEIQLLSKSH